MAFYLENDFNNWLTTSAPRKLSPKSANNYCSHIQALLYKKLLCVNPESLEYKIVEKLPDILATDKVFAKEFLDWLNGHVNKYNWFTKQKVIDKCHIAFTRYEEFLMGLTSFSGTPLSNDDLEFLLYAINSLGIIIKPVFSQGDLKKKFKLSLSTQDRLTENDFFPIRLIIKIIRGGAKAKPGDHIDKWLNVLINKIQFLTKSKSKSTPDPYLLKDVDKLEFDAHSHVWITLKNKQKTKVLLYTHTRHGGFRPFNIEPNISQISIDHVKPIKEDLANNTNHPYIDYIFNNYFNEIDKMVKAKKQNSYIANQIYKRIIEDSINLPSSIKLPVLIDGLIIDLNNIASVVLLELMETKENSAKGTGIPLAKGTGII